MRTVLTRRMLLLGILLMSTGFRLVITPSITTSAQPTEGRPVVVTVNDMPDPGVWTIKVTFSTGDSDPVVVIIDSDNGEVTTTPPVGSSGGTMTVEVSMGADTARSSFGVL